MTHAGRILAVLAGVILSGCASEGANPLRASMQSVAQIWDASPGPDLRSSLTASDISGPSLFVEMEQSGRQALAKRRGSSQGHVRYQTDDGVSFTLFRGLLSATRGLGGDLMIADLDQVADPILGGAGQGIRIHRYINGEDEITAQAFVCDFVPGGSHSAVTVLGSVSARQIDESCVGQDYSFENRYWIGASGIVKSRQWVGPKVGYATIERLGG